MVLGFVATGRLIKRFEQGGRKVVTSWLFGLTVIEMVTMLVFALTGMTWVAIGAMLGVFFARNLAGPLYTIWLNEQISDSSVRATVLSISGPGERDRPGRRRAGAGRDRQRLGHPRRAHGGRPRDRSGPLVCTAGRSPTRAASPSSRSSRRP